VVYFALNIKDINLTNKLIREGHTEANPIVRFLMDKLGRWWALIKLPSFICMSLVAYHNAWWLLVGGVVLYAWVVWHNMKIDKKNEQVV